MSPRFAVGLVLIVLGPVNHAFAQVTGIDLGSLGGAYSYPRAVNNKGQIVGYSETVAKGPKHAFLWSASSGMLDLGTLGGTESVALGVNATGQIVGSSYVDAVVAERLAVSDEVTYAPVQPHSAVDFLRRR